MVYHMGLQGWLTLDFALLHRETLRRVLGSLGGREYGVELRCPGGCRAEIGGPGRTGGAVRMYGARMRHGSWPRGGGQWG